MTEEQNADATEATDTDAPETGTESGAADRAPAEESGDLATQLSERTADLQRITAEYHNYRKRVERDRAVAAEHVTAGVISGLLPVLDDIDRAREHGDLEGPFATVAEQLLNALVKLGLEVFGEKGDPFDPVVHEAVAHMVSPEVTETSCIDVMRRGYRIGDRLLRPAMVAVAEPAETPAEPAASAQPESVDEPSETEVETDPDADAAAEAGETGDATPNLDADVPDDEEQLKAEQVQDAVAAAAESEAEAGEQPTGEERPESAEDKPDPVGSKKSKKSKKSK